MKDLNGIFNRDLDSLTRTNDGRVEISHVYDSSLPMLSAFYDKYYHPEHQMV